jgi:hypothetical protein
MKSMDRSLGLDDYSMKIIVLQLFIALCVCVCPNWMFFIFSQKAIVFHIFAATFSLLYTNYTLK